MPDPGLPQALQLGLRLLLLLALANNAPIAARLLLGERWNRPLDGGTLFADGRPWLGPSKTWRGLIAAILVSTLVAPVLGFAPVAGLLAGAVAMAGDALASFTKRRLGIASSGQCFGLDQVPESLLPLLALAPVLGLGVPMIAAVTLAFLLIEPPAARLGHRFGWRDRPY
ncbi:CDP-archaeol synthase [Ramlibacter sp.]|uniref:CDP-archaeol synthase n=1 Tax=Ramlibacter sp. TaxID=1917967 RepID=UPI002FCAE654